MEERKYEELSEFMSQEYEKAMNFWDQWLGQTGEETEETDVNTSWKEIGSEGLVNITTTLGSQKNVLDYGCGSGWASVIIAKSGCPRVTAVEVSENGIKASEEYARTFGVEHQILFQTIPTNWLENQSKEQYDGVFCCNVLDVVPKAICDGILKGIACVSKKGAKIIIILNPYLSEEYLVKVKAEEHEKKHYFMQGILRLVNRSDEEWKGMFEQYFTVSDCKYFRWDGEPDTTKRRAFILER